MLPAKWSNGDMCLLRVFRHKMQDDYCRIAKMLPGEFSCTEVAEIAARDTDYNKNDDTDTDNESSSDDRPIKRCAYFACLF